MCRDPVTWCQPSSGFRSPCVDANLGGLPMRTWGEGGRRRERWQALTPGLSPPPPPPPSPISTTSPQLNSSIPSLTRYPSQSLPPQTHMAHTLNTHTLQYHEFPSTPEAQRGREPAGPALWSLFPTTGLNLSMSTPAADPQRPCSAPQETPFPPQPPRLPEC